MKGKPRPVHLAAGHDREFESLLRRATRMSVPSSPRRLRKVSRRKSSAAD